MNKKLFGMMIATIFIISAFAAIAGKETNSGQASIGMGDSTNTISYTTKHNFAAPSVVTTQDYAVIQVPETYSNMIPGYPILPYSKETITFPLGTIITSVEATTSGVQTTRLPAKILPAAEPAPLNGQPAVVERSEGSVYTDNQVYPSDWVQFHTGAGIKNGQRVTFITIHFYPTRYMPASNDLEYVDHIEAKISYETPAQPMVQSDDYDLLIITADSFVSSVQPLVDHKASYGVSTLLVTTSEIYASSTGRDEQEQIKYYIKETIENYGIDYVLLVGGLTSLISGQEWHVPVRYAHNDVSGEPTYISDLYYADIYNADSSFASWDTNDNGRYGEWRFGGKDTIDGYPDVYVGRLACRNTREVQTVVEKIITYESTADPSWYNTVTLVAGDTFNDINGNNFLEGEAATQTTAEYMDGFTVDKIWWSEGNLKISNVMDALNEGSGFVHYSGHGSPGMWMGKDFTDNSDGEYILGMEVYHMSLLKNEGKYPVWIIGGCHNSMFNATFVDSSIGCINSLFGGSLTWYWMPIPECFGWWPVKVSGGGAIGTIGCTGLGYGTIGDSNEDDIPDCIQFLLGYLETRFFELIGQEDVDVLGEVWGTAISDYNDLFPPMDDKTDLKTIEGWALLGDPSLKLGGYTS